MAYRIVNEIDSSDPPPPSANPSSTTNSQAQSPAQSRKGDGSLKGGVGAVGVNGSRKMDEEEERDAVFYRLEMLGYRVGQGLVERYYLPLSPVSSL